MRKLFGRPSGPLMYAAWTASIIAGVTHGDGNDRVAYPVAAIGIVLWLCLAYRTFVRRG